MRIGALGLYCVSTDYLNDTEWLTEEFTQRAGVEYQSVEGAIGAIYSFPRYGFCYKETVRYVMEGENFDEVVDEVRRAHNSSIYAVRKDRTY